MATLFNVVLNSNSTKKIIDPELYMTPFHDLALQYATTCLRSEGTWIVGQSVGPIGWRVRKHYFKVTQKSCTNKHSPGHTQKHQLTKVGSQSHGKNFGINSPSSSFEKDVKEIVRDEFLLNWTEFGPDRYFEDKETSSILKSLMTIEHPYIQPIEYVASGDNGALVIRKFNKAGTLKDLLCGCVPINPFLTKYGSPKGRNPIPLKDLALYGRQIIEALRFLHSNGIAHGHLHAGNVIIVDGCAKLLEIENFLLGVPSFYRPFFIQHNKINSLEAIDVYALGHLIYELALGYPMQESYARQIVDCPESLKNLLELLLLRDSLKGSLPTLDQLLKHKFFSEYAPNFDEVNAKYKQQSSQQIKMAAIVKDHIILHSQKCELRLRDEQRSVKNQKRLVRVQELMTSEEKEKKQKQKEKKTEQKQAKLRAQNSLQLQNTPQPISAIMIKSDSASSISSTQHKQQMTVLTPPPIPTTSRQEFSLPPSVTQLAKFDVKETDCILKVEEDFEKIDLSDQTSTNLSPPKALNRGELRKTNSN